MRARLVLALVLMTTVGLALFGVVVFSFYARTQYQRVDDQLRSSVTLASGLLTEQAGLDRSPKVSGSSTRDGGPRPEVILPPGTYAELRDGSGTVVAVQRYSDQTTASTPDLSKPITGPPTGSTIFSTGSATGSGRWRVLVQGVEGQPGYSVAIAVPLTEVADALQRLVVVEVMASVGLLLVLGAGSWLIVRRGLQPLESMATSARSITAGDLSQRVEPADGKTEVGQLGQALNTMLGDMEVAFQEREATERKLRQFLSDASHELRTPLTSIQGFAELFRLGAQNDHVDQAVIMRRIEQESARMRVLVDDLLLLARLDETRPIEKAPVDLAVLAADACSDAVAAAPDRAMTLDAPSAVMVLGDRDHLRQAIGNLVANARRHTPAGTAIEVAARRDGDDAVVTIRDHGPGLDEVALEHVFDRFWQADLARVGAGAGLGLAIVAGIAAEHGGDCVAANAPDGGACFTLRLPAP